MVGRLALTMLCIQFAIGVLNDWADRHLDAASKPWKPLVAGLVSPRVALATALALIAAAMLLATYGGFRAWLLAMGGLGIGVAYDLGLKRTPLSALTYAVALPLLPLWVWTALDRGSTALVIVLPLGMLLGFGLQLVNALPDAGADAAGGLRGTVQWLGPERARRAAWGTLAGAGLLALGLARPAGLHLVPFLPCWLGAAVLYGAALAAYRRQPGERALRLGWNLLAPAVAVLAAGWLASLP